MARVELSNTMKNRAATEGAHSDDDAKKTSHSVNAPKNSVP
jgi:hypothetical protein